MKVLVLSDIHGNLEALNAVMEESQKLEWQEIWFLGDLCGYGPDVEACFERLKKERLIFIPGNHDLYICGRLNGRYFSYESRKSLLLTHSIISGSIIKVMKSLPLFRIVKGVHLVHGSPEEPSRNYILDENDAFRNFKISRKKCILFGHSHLQEYYRFDKSGITASRATNGETISYKESRVLINPGSVGQPRDRDNRAAWGLLNTKSKEFTFYRTSYNFKVTQRKMEALGFSKFLISRLAEGR